MHRADVALLAAGVTERPPHLPDAGGEGSFADEAFGPDVVDQFVLGDDALVVLDKVGEDVEGLWFQGAGCTALAQLEKLRVQLERIKGVDHRSPAPARGSCYRRALSAVQRRRI